MKKQITRLLIIIFAVMLTSNSSFAGLADFQPHTFTQNLNSGAGKAQYTEQDDRYNYAGHGQFTSEEPIGFEDNVEERSLVPKNNQRYL